MSWINLVQGRDQRNSCEHGNEPSGSITFWENSRVAISASRSWLLG
jgi:hypothetical protein